MGAKTSSLKEEADRLMKQKGNIRGAVLKTHAVYIRHREGEEGVKKVEEKLKELGYSLKFKEIKLMGWYPDGLRVLAMLCAKKLFNWTEKDIFEMGNTAPKYSFIVSLFMKYFLSVKDSYEASPGYWRKHFDFGELEAPEFNEKEKYLVVRLKGYKSHPLECVYQRGYFLRIAQYVIKSKKITIEETKCPFRGDRFHEHIIRWE